MASFLPIFITKVSEILKVHVLEIKNSLLKSIEGMILQEDEELD